MDFYYNLLKDAKLPPFSAAPIWMLGQRYTPLEAPVAEEGMGGGIATPEKVFPAFFSDFCSRFWFTYRKDFPNIEPSYFTSDAGWGCMLRSGQMVLAQAFAFHFLGRDWRLDSDHSPVYDEILSWFADLPSTDCPYSIHNIAQLGLKYGKNVGEWFGPSTISQVLEDIMSTHQPGSLRLYASSDGCLYLDQITALCQSNDKDAKEKEDWHPLVILIPLRLGLDSLNMDYVPAVKEIFHYPQSLGIIGGRPRSSLYFVGYQDDDVFYLDPHTIQPAVPLRKRTNSPSQPQQPQEDKEKEKETEKEEETVMLEKTYVASYHCPVPQKIAISDMDPSLAVAFYCRDRKQFDDFCKRSVNSPIFNVEKKTPEYLVKRPPPEHHEKLFSDDEDDIVFL